MAASRSTSSPRDHQADADPDRARKKQRLGDDVSDTSPEPSIIIEADEPEEIGTSFANAIQFEDEILFMAPYSEAFASLGLPGSPVDQIRQLHAIITQNQYLNAARFIDLAKAIKLHVECSADDPAAEWRRRYLDDDADLFTRLAVLCVAILDCNDLFDPRAQYHPVLLRQAFEDFFIGLQILCRRIIPFLPDELRTTLSRRDSGPVASKQQSLGALLYVAVAPRVLFPEAPFVLFIAQHFERKHIIDDVMDRNRIAFFTDNLIYELASVIRTLSGGMREVQESWIALSSTLDLLKHAIMFKCPLGRPFPNEACEEVLGVFGSCILPAICGKHPRALPETFHARLAHTASAVLRTYANRCPRENAPRLYGRFVKSENDALLPAISSTDGIETSLWRVAQDEQQELASLLSTSWSMQAFLSYIQSDIMDIRTAGILLLKECLVAIYYQHHETDEKFDLPLPQYAVRFLRQNEVTSYIFGPECRAGLVGHSTDIVCFLAATSTYTAAETDIIWRTCSTSVEADLVKASFSVLDSLCRFLDFGNMIYILQKYTTTPIERLGNDAVTFFDRLVHALEACVANSGDPSLPLTLVSAIIDVLKAATTSTACEAKDEICSRAMVAVVRFAEPGTNVADRAEIYKQCIPDIQRHTPHATAAVQILTHFLSTRMQQREAEVVLGMLPVAAAVEELCNFVHATQPEDITHTRIADVVSRLDCIIHLMNIDTDPTEEKTADNLFDCTLGPGALCNAARDYAWNKLQELASKQPAITAASSLWQTYMQQRVTDLAADHATPMLVTCIGNSLKAEFTLERVRADPFALLALPLWRTLVRLATDAVERPVLDKLVDVILDLLFVYPLKTSIPAALVVPSQCEFVREHIQTLCEDCERLIPVDEVAAVRKFSRGIQILDATLNRSKTLSAHYATTKQPQTLVIGDADMDTDALLFTAQVYGPHLQPKMVQIRGSPQAKVSELLAILPPVTAATENRVIVGGQEISLNPDLTLQDAKIQQSGVIMISPIYSFDLNLEQILTHPGPVEQVVMSQYEALESFLDGPQPIAQQAFEFLFRVRASAQARAKVVSPTTTAADLFPTNKPWRSRLSLAVLQRHLTDFIQLGVADQDFISRSIERLLHIIMDVDRPFDPMLIIEAARSLTLFFQNLPRPLVNGVTNEQASLESRVQSQSTSAHIGDEARFVSRIASLIFEALRMPRRPVYSPGRMPLRTSVSWGLYAALIEACRADPGLWSAVMQHPTNAELHKWLLLDFDPGLSKEFASRIRDLCRDAPRSVAEGYWYTLFPSLVDATQCGPLCENYFDLLKCVFADIEFAEDVQRNYITIFGEHLRDHQHTESPRLMVSDKAVAGLLEILGIAVHYLKSYKTPLNLHGSPPELLQRLLFPTTGTDRSVRPLTSPDTRQRAFSLVKWTFEAPHDYDELLDILDRAFAGFPRDLNLRYPGAADWSRQPWNAAGLCNLGMTCYMNSLLQQLYANLQFRKFIFDQPITDPHKQAVLSHVQVLFAHMQHNTSPTINPERLADALQIQTGNQEDVHTFYTTLFSRLEEGLGSPEHKAALAKFFTGKSVTQIKGECGHVSNRTEPFTELSITVKNKTGLAESLEEFVQGEPLEGANKYMCMTCRSGDGGRLINAVKRTCLEDVPDNLTLCLKRFTYESMLDGENKVNDRFDFPDAIDMSLYKRSYLESSDGAREPDVFELVGVIVHQGSLQFGHYWSYVRVPRGHGPQGDPWLYLEDTKAVPCPGGIQEVQKQCFGGPRWSNGSDRADSAYVLFYQRQSSIAEALAMNSATTEVFNGNQMLPEVPLPPRMQMEIDVENDFREFQSTFFSPSLAEFIVWLLAQYPGVLAKRAAQREVTETHEPEMEEDETGAESHTERMLARVILGYLAKTLPAHAAFEALMEPFLHALHDILDASPNVALHILTDLSQDGMPFANIVRQDDAKTRRHFFAAVEICLVALRERIPDMYERTVVPLIRSHGSVIGLNLDLARGRWSEYLDFAANLAQMSPREKGIVLDQGYMIWALEVIAMRFDMDARRAHVDLWNWWKLNHCDLSPLYEFIYVLLKDHVDLCEETQYLPAIQAKREYGEGLGWCLTRDEFEQLFKCRDQNGRKLWIPFLTASAYCKVGPRWQDYSPGKLVGLLFNGDKSNYVMIRLLEDSIQAYFDHEENELLPMLHMTLHVCSNRSDEDSGPTLRSLSKNLEMWTDREKDSLWFFEQAHTFAPVAVISAIPQCLTSFLLSKRQPSRLRAAVFLNEYLFRPAPLSENDVLDATRINVTRTLVPIIQGRLHDAYSHEAGRSSYECAIETLGNAKTYLMNVIPAIAQAKLDGHTLSPQVQIEADEVKATLSAINRTLTELKHWEPETTTLPTRPLEVRKSVEMESGENEEHETSDGDDADADADADVDVDVDAQEEEETSSDVETVFNDAR